MPQSLANVLVHLVFSTKDRALLLDDVWRDELHGYIGGIIRRTTNAMSGTEPTTIPTPTALSITTPTASTVIARGATPGRSQNAKFRPNGADGSSEGADTTHSSIQSSTRTLFQRMSPHEPSEPTAGIPLEASVDELRRRCEAVARFQGGSSHYQEELGTFRNYAAEKGFFLADPPPELSRTPDEEGNEHQVWVDRDSAFTA